MAYPSDVLFDIETLITMAQPERILVLGDAPPSMLANFAEQRAILNQSCEIHRIEVDDIDDFWGLEDRFNVAIAINLFEHLNKKQGMHILSRLRDVLCPQFCICLPLATVSDSEGWLLNDLFSFALKKVASYPHKGNEFGLFTYSIDDYKNTPDWLNADNWANPEMWGKYRW